jgi:S-adenosylmethionine:tRNA ribosyltransferase-isomerase
MLRLSDFDYNLPEDRIAQEPAEPRDSSKLLVLSDNSISHRKFSDLPALLEPGDLIVLNNTRVTARRLLGERETGGKIEALLLRQIGDGQFEALVKPAKRLKPGTKVSFGAALRAEIMSEGKGGLRILRFQGDGDISALVEASGSVPLPPYITKTTAPDERYQTIYSAMPGSSAAPTAGLHFTDSLLQSLKQRGIETAYVTLDVGIDTFRPVQTENLIDHKMHGERYIIPAATRDAVAAAKGRVIAVGTTTVRALETASIGKRMLKAGEGCSSLFITPGYEFKTVDAMLTNFHMPRTTMLLMVSALCGKDTLFHAYEEALKNDYRFLSFGDSMLILNPSKGENHA